MFRLTALIYTVAAIAIIVLMAMRPPVDVKATTNQATASTANASEKTQSTATATDTTETQVSTEASTSSIATENATSTEVQENNAAAPTFPTEITPASETPVNTPEASQAPASSTEVTPAQAVEEAANKEKEAVADENNTATQPAETSTISPEATKNVIDTPLDALTDGIKKNLK